MNLDETIKQYYFDNLQSLSEDKRFHFGSRIAAWLSDPRALDVLRDLRSYMVPAESVGARALIEQLLNRPQSGRRNAHDLRQIYFEKYPKLWGIHLVLFRVRHLKYVYGIDVLGELFEVVNRRELDELASQLLSDEEAIRILSTFAINYLYLYKQILLGDTDYVNPETFIKIGNGYNTSNSKLLQLMIYLYTHCIIGDSNFYTQNISPNNKVVFRQMLEVLDKLIRENFDAINLDNKLEFLVCCRICGYDSDLFKLIHNECRNSLSDEGHFLIDRHNQNRQEDKATLETSEHRNVLFIMSSSAYHPSSTLVR